VSHFDFIMAASDSDDDLAQAMNAASSPACSPLPPRSSSTLGKRLRDDLESDGEDVPAHPLATATPGQPRTSINPNIVMVARKYAAKKKLRGDQLSETETFLNVQCPSVSRFTEFQFIAFLQDPPSAREAKIFINLLALNNNLHNVIKSSTPPFAITVNLEVRNLHIFHLCIVIMLFQKNIKKYTGAVLASTKVSGYKGPAPLRHVLVRFRLSSFKSLTFDFTFKRQDILKKYRWDMPPDVERNAADWGKIVSKVQYELTQVRSHWKKVVSLSFYPL
jgi:hypothetical protein